jgi:putative Holliday junction resolvase
LSRVLAIDYGERRIGLAVSDPTRTIAQPLSTMLRRAGKRIPFSKLVDTIKENDVTEVVVGLPLTLEGEDSDWTRAVRAFAQQLQERSGVPVNLLDERMTSVRAQKTVSELGLRKSQREQKERIDSAAALILLQMFLDRAHRS